MAPTLTDHMICWNPGGNAALFRWPDTERASRAFSHTTGACDMHVHRMNALHRRHWLMSTALGMILRDNVAPEIVHRALWPLKDYRDALPPDVQGPQFSGPRECQAAAQPVRMSITDAALDELLPGSRQ